MKVTVCIGSSCHIKGSRQVVEKLQDLIKEADIGDKVELAGTFCMGKCQQGVCVSVDDSFFSVSPDSVNDFFETRNENEENIKINQFEVSELIENRLNEIMDLVKKELANLLDCDVDYILFTGGTSDMDHFDYILNENFGKKAHVGRINIVGCRKNSYSVALGNIIYFINKLKLKGKSYSMISPKDCEELSSAKRNSANLVSESKIGIVTQYFFGE